MSKSAGKKRKKENGTHTHVRHENATIVLPAFGHGKTKGKDCPILLASFQVLQTETKRRRGGTDGAGESAGAKHKNPTWQSLKSPVLRRLESMLCRTLSPLFRRALKLLPSMDSSLGICSTRSVSHARDRQKRTIGGRGNALGTDPGRKSSSSAGIPPRKSPPLGPRQRPGDCTRSFFFNFANF